MFKKSIFFLFIIIFVSIQLMQAQGLSLSSIFSDGMVLQQKSNAQFWGVASAGESIRIIADWGETITTLAQSNGSWKTTLPTHNAGGPYSITIKGKHKTMKIANVLLGEVWLCSGQSNMEMPLSGWPPLDTIRGSEREIKASKNSSIRMFTVQRASSLKEENNCIGSWEESSPAT